MKPKPKYYVNLFGRVATLGTAFHFLGVHNYGWAATLIVGWLALSATAPDGES